MSINEEHERLTLGTRYPDGNPKTQFGVKKPPLMYIPATGIIHQGLAHLHGHLKYGHFNWREEPVTASTYINAALRHILDYMEGASPNDTASDSGILHLAHAIACLNILIDAAHHNTLHDDRHRHKTDFDALFKEIEPILNRLYEEWGPELAKRTAQREQDEATRQDLESDHWVGPTIPYSTTPNYPHPSKETPNEME